MRFSLAAATAILATAHARITGLAVPETIKPGDTVEALLLTENYIQTVYDVAVAFGYDAGDGYPGSLGIVLDSCYLGPGQSNQLHNISKSITIPKTAKAGDYIINASLMSLYGVSSGPTLTPFNVTVTFGDETSTTYKSNRL